MNNIQKQIITGSLLGDGSLTKIYKNNNSAFREGHCIKQHDYILWKFEQLKPYSCSIKKEQRNVIVDYDKNLNLPIKGDKKTDFYVMRTQNNKVFTELEHEWYVRDDTGNYILKNKRRIKKIPNFLELSPLSISIWFMDDGTNQFNNRNAIFHSLSFSKTECEQLCDLIKKNGIKYCEVRPYSKDKNKFEIVVYAKSYLDFISMIDENTPCECMIYKSMLNNYVPRNYGAKSKEHLSNIIEMYKSGVKQKDIAKKLNLSEGLISQIISGKLWSNLTKLPIKNLPNNNSSGVKGIYFNKKSKKWMARKRHDKQTKYIGLFDTLEEAKKAYDSYLV